MAEEILNEEEREWLWGLLEASGRCSKSDKRQALIREVGKDPGRFNIEGTEHDFAINFISQLIEADDRETLKKIVEKVGPEVPRYKQEVSKLRAKFSIPEPVIETPSIPEPVIETSGILFRRIFLTVGVSVCVTFIVMLGRFSGILQSLEFKAFDFLMQTRSPEDPDPRLLIIEIDQRDYDQEIEKAKDLGLSLPGSISDESLIKLFKELNQHKPIAIGLDLYRETPGDNLKTYLAGTDNLFGVCLGLKNGGTIPPSGIDEEKIGFSDFPPGEQTVRRHLLMQEPRAEAKCTAKYAFSLVLARHYLESKGYEYKDPVPKEGKDLQIDNVVFKRFRPPFTGAYQYSEKKEWMGYQILLNYRCVETQDRATTCSPGSIAKKYTLREVLDENKLKKQDVKGNIVLIGSKVKTWVSDDWRTPYNAEEISGVIIQAQMVSQIISAVIDKRNLLEAQSFWIESLYIGVSSLIGGIFTWCFRLLLSRLSLGFAVLIIVLGVLAIIIVVFFIYVSCATFNLIKAHHSLSNV